MEKNLTCACLAALVSFGAYADELPENLFDNSEFNDGTKGWGLSHPKVERVETMALSGQWVIRALGPMYLFLSGTPRSWKAGEQFTLAIRARSLGSGSALRIVQMGRNAEGVTKEGTYATMLTAVGPEFHEYWIPFTTAAHLTPTFIQFYKVDSKAPDTGLDIDSIRIFRGKITPFEVRKIGRPGRQAPVAGTEIKPRDNLYGESAKKFRALVVSPNKYFSMRDAVNLFAGTGVAFDQIYCPGKNEDVYCTDDDPDAIVARLKKGQYDVYVMNEKQRDILGPQLKGMLATNLTNGAKLYAKSLRADADYARVGLDEFPFEAVWQAEVFAEIVRLVKGAGAQADGQTRTQTARRIYGGQCHVFTRVSDENGLTVDWRHDVESVVGARLGAYQDDGARVTVAVDDVTEGLALAWAFADFSGRTLARGEVEAKASNTLEMPLSKLYTNLGIVRLALKRGDETVDCRTEAVYARTNDLARVYEDYTPSMWPMSTGMIDADRVYRQLANTGLRAAQMATAGADCWPLSLRSGLAVGANSIGGSWFWLPGKLKGRERIPNVNTAAARKGIFEGAAKRGREFAKYGAVQTFIQDEGEMVRNGCADETDNNPENVAAYRAYMERKYKTIAEYNRRHRSAHASFADLDETLLADARKSGNFAEYIEWRNFNVDRWCEAIKTCADGAHSTCPDVKVSLINTFGEGSLNGNDYWKYITKTGCDTSVEYMTPVYFGSTNPVNIFDEFYRSFRPDMKVWGYTGYFYSPERARFLPWWTACHRYGGFTWFAATCWGYNLIDLPSYALTVDGDELRQSLTDSKMLTGLGKVLTCWPWAGRDVALYYSHDSVHVATCLGTDSGTVRFNASGWLHDLMHSRLQSQFLVESLLYQHDFVAPEQIEKGKLLEGYRILYMAHVLAMSDAEVASVKAFLAKGGKVVADILPGDYDELGVKRSTNPFEGAGIVVTGKPFKVDDPQRAMVLEQLKSAGATPALTSPGVMAHAGREAMHYVSGRADVYAVIRSVGRAQDKDEETFVFARRGHVYDTIAGRYCGKSDRITVRVPPNEGRVFAVLPAKIESVGVSGLPRNLAIRRGEDVSLDCTIVSDDLTADYVLHVSFVPPSGKTNIHFDRNVATKAGRAHVDFALALDDAPGEWKVRITEALSGVTTERVFNVE